MYNYFQSLIFVLHLVFYSERIKISSVNHFYALTIFNKESFLENPEYPVQ